MRTGRLVSVLLLGAAIWVLTLAAAASQPAASVAGVSSAPKGKWFRPEMTLEVPAGGIGTFDLGLALKDDLAHGAHKTTLVARGDAAGLATRDLTVTKDADEAPAGNVLGPEWAVDITLTAVSLTPSPMDNPLAFVLAGLIILGLLTLTRRLARWPKSSVARKTLIGLATILLVSGAGVAVADPHWWPPVKAKPIAVSHTVPGGLRGTVASQNGTIAQLHVDDAKHEIAPTDLTTASTFKGKYDLAPDKDGGAAEAQVHVRDIWPYALVAIAIGIAVSYALRLWVLVGRPRTKLRWKAARLQDDYEKDLEGFASRNEGAPYGGININHCIGARLREIDGQLNDADELEAAQKEFDTLQSYVDTFFDLTRELENLETARKHLANAEDRLKELAQEVSEKPDVGLGKRYKESGDLLEQIDIGNSERDCRVARLNEVLLQVKDMRERIIKATNDARSVLDVVEAADHLIYTTKDAALGYRAWSERVTVTGDGERLLLSDEELPPDRYAERVDSLAELGHTIEPDLAASGREGGTSLDQTYFARSPSYSFNPQAILYGHFRLPTQQSRPQAKITWHRVGEELPDPAEPVHAGERIIFEIAIESSKPLPFTTVEVEFGDGEAVQLELPADGPDTVTAVSCAHRYQHGGKRTVSVRTGPNEEPLALIVLEVHKETRTGLLESDLANKDRAFAAVVFVLAVGSGMTALYFPDPAWGELDDYLAAILWGGVAAEGVKLAGAAVDGGFFKKA